MHPRITDTLSIVIPLIALVVGALLALPAFALASLEGTPQGFEQLAAEHQSVVTLYYGGDVLGNFPIHATPQTLRFDSPDAVIAAIPAIRNKAQVRSILAAPMPNNIDQLCTAKRVEHCGKLVPETVGIIFDENRLAGELFFSPNILDVIDHGGTRYLPLPKSDFSSVYGFTGAVNGIDQQTPTYTVTNSSTFAMGEKKLAAQTTVTNQGLRFDTASIGTEREGVSATAGLLQSRPMQLISDRDMLGVSVSSSRRTILDSHKSEGNAVILFLPRQSFVSLYREGRLYSSRSYEAGNQLIDTTELPEGAYDITLKIQEADGSTRTEKRFFAKSLDLPPMGEPTYYAQAGVIRATASTDTTIPQLTDNPMVAFGTARRITDNAGLNVAVLGLKDRATSEVGMSWMNTDTQARVVGLASTKGDLGAGGSLFYNQKELSAALDVRQLWLAKSPMPGYEDMTNSFTQVSATGNYALNEDVTLGLRASYSKQGNMQASTSFGPYAEWRIWQEGERMLGLSANAARTDGQNQGNILLSFSYRLGENGVSGSAGNSIGKDTGQFGSLRAWHDHELPSGEGLIVGGGVSGDKRNQTIGGDVDWRNHMGQLRGSVQQGLGSNSTTNYGGSFAVNAAQLSDELYVGGAQTDSSAVVVDTAGDSDATMKVFVNNMQRSTVKVGDQQVIYLSPFHIYTIRIAPEKNALLDYDPADRKVTLYPGNVTKVHWDVNRFYIVSATILQEDGTPLADALLKGSRDQTTTNERGRLQAEIANPKRMTFTDGDAGTCAVDLPAMAPPKDGVLVYRTPLICRKVSQNADQH